MDWYRKTSNAWVNAYEIYVAIWRQNNEMSYIFTFVVVINGTLIIAANTL